MRYEIKKAIKEYVDESVYGDYEYDFIDLLTYLAALDLRFDEESELNEIEEYYYSIAE